MQLWKCELLPREGRAKWTLFRGWNMWCGSSSASVPGRHREKANKEGMPAGQQSYNSGLHLEANWDLGLCLAAGRTAWFCDVDWVFSTLGYWWQFLKKGFFFWLYQPGSLGTVMANPADLSCPVLLGLNPINGALMSKGSRETLPPRRMGRALPVYVSIVQWWKPSQMGWLELQRAWRTDAVGELILQL